MAEVRWTPEQEKVISLRNRNILVSAAAGSGKTAVLVERIISRITEDGQDIDRILVVTFTKAAAGEMRDRIRSAIEKKLEENPDDEHLQKQSVLLHQAHISTIHSFCTYILHNYIHLTDLDPSFSIADGAALKLLKKEALQEILEEAYTKESYTTEEFGSEEAAGDAYRDFLLFSEAFAQGKTDESLEDMIERLYEFSFANPDPEIYLKQCLNPCKAKSLEELEESVLFQEFIRTAGLTLGSILEEVRHALSLAEGEGGPYFYAEAISDDLEHLEKLLHAQTYDTRYQMAESWQWKRLANKKKGDICDDALKEEVKQLRDDYKKQTEYILKRFFVLSEEEILVQMKQIKPYLEALIRLTERFSARFREKKLERNLLDFSDLEHEAYRILMRKTEKGEVRTDAAKELAERFEEVMIDEYQDINLLQESLLYAVSREADQTCNRFMVGDMKQSIYGFRMARPDLFLEKYRTYTKEDGNRQRIDLHKNFRSRTEVLSLVNDLFFRLMDGRIGDLIYDEDAALYPGASFPAETPENEGAFCAELLLIDQSAGEFAETSDKEVFVEAEAVLIANRIRELLKSGQVYDRGKSAFRKVRPSDIVILLRSDDGRMQTFLRILRQTNIPAYGVRTKGYFSTMEVMLVLDYLRILDNPRQEIPFAAVLRSPMCGCTDEELAVLKIAFPELPIYEAARRYIGMENAQNVLREKLLHFFRTWQALRAEVPYRKVYEIVMHVLEDTGFFDMAAAMPQGAQREANLRMLIEKAVVFEKGNSHNLAQFLQFIEQMDKYSVDAGEANIAGEEADTVRIMTIHKSKGLEFPIVFLASCHKTFNMTDINHKIVMHPTLGVGIDCYQMDLRIRTQSLLKQALRLSLLDELKAEELRLLYVALTRPKEKLIMTGVFGGADAYKLVQEEQTGYCRKAANAAALNYFQLTESDSYLKWILAALHHESPVRIRIVSGKEIGETAGNDALEEKTELLRMAAGSGRCYVPKLHDRLNEITQYVYPHSSEADLPAKLSVSELKRRMYEPEETSRMFEEEPVVPVIPEFMRDGEVETATGAARGTLYHKAFYLLDFQDCKTVEAVEDQIKRFCLEGRLESSDGIRAEELFAFAGSDLGVRMQAADALGLLRKEQPFVVDIPANEVDDAYTETEPILIQGIIDAYFMEEDGWILLDYKTDRVQKEEQLLQRYRIQLELYKRALEQITGIPVLEAWIYSTELRSGYRVC